MSMEYFYRGKWRAVSAPKARLLREKGYRVRKAGEAAVVVHAPEKQRPANPAPPWPTQPKTIIGLAASEAPSPVATGDAASPVSGQPVRQEKIIGQLGTQAAFDLTDEELERLTAPDSDASNGGEG